MRERHFVGLEYLNSALNISYDDGINLDYVLEFFGTHFTVNASRPFQKRIADIFITVEDALPGVPYEHACEVYIRKSNSEFFTITGHQWTEAGVEYVFASKACTLIAFDTANGEIRISCTQDTRWDHFNMVMMELIRDLVLKHEENQGTVVIHACCAYKNGGAGIIAGPKGAGKSSVLLDLVIRYGYEFMSGDKSFLTVQEGVVLVRGWPDYPHLGLGTLSNYPTLVERFELGERIRDALQAGDIWSTEYKIALDPLRFQEVVPMARHDMTAPVEFILLPELSPEGLDIVPVTDGSDDVASHMERRFGEAHSDWNHYIEQADTSVIENATASLMNHIKALPTYKITHVDAIQGSFLERLSTQTTRR